MVGLGGRGPLAPPGSCQNSWSRQKTGQDTSWKYQVTRTNWDPFNLECCLRVRDMGGRFAHQRNRGAAPVIGQTSLDRRNNATRFLFTGRQRGRNEGERNWIQKEIQDRGCKQTLQVPLRWWTAIQGIHLWKLENYYGCILSWSGFDIFYSSQCFLLVNPRQKPWLKK